MEDIADALEAVMGAHGRSLDDGRIKTLAMIIHDQGWKREELRQAARILASDPTLRDHIRFGGTITPADFEGVRRGEQTRIEEDGEVRIVTTLRGSALKVHRAKLYSYNEAIDLWNAMGSPGRFADSRQRQYDNARFSVVDVDGQTWFRLK